ncbi:hypothetical protein B0H15DRAFT_743157, partial [Mycena belliarum]
PCMLLHDLGSFSDDPVLRERVNGIFNKDRHTFLVNAPGTGKTRLAFEGLCQNWGLYFTAAVDSSDLGSNDMNRILRNEVRWALRRPSRNDASRQTICRLFVQLLLSRLLVFHMFVQLAQNTGISEYHKKLWLIAQLR